MKKLAPILVLLFSIVFINPGFIFAADPTCTEQTSSETAKTPVLEKIGDWFATFGKSKEEKERILQEREINRVAQEEAPEMKTYKEKFQSDLNNLQGKAAQEVLAAEAKAAKIKEEAAIKADKLIAAAKEKMQNQMAQFKEKAASEFAVYKEKFKEQFKEKAANSLNRAKEFINNIK